MTAVDPALVVFTTTVIGLAVDVRKSSSHFFAPFLTFCHLMPTSDLSPGDHWCLNLLGDLFNPQHPSTATFCIWLSHKLNWNGFRFTTKGTQTWCMLAMSPLYKLAIASHIIDKGYTQTW